MFLFRAIQDLFKRIATGCHARPFVFLVEATDGQKPVGPDGLVWSLLFCPTAPGANRILTIARAGIFNVELHREAQHLFSALYRTRSSSQKAHVWITADNRAKFPYQGSVLILVKHHDGPEFIHPYSCKRHVWTSQSPPLRRER